MAEQDTGPERSIVVLTHLASEQTEAIASAVPQARFVQVPMEGPLPEGVHGEACLTLAWGSPNMKEVLDRGVRWVHTIGTGVDRFPLDLLTDQQLTCSRGVSAVPIAEWVMAMMLAFEKRLPGSWVDEPPERWNWGELGCLHGKTLGLIGFGGIGEAIATRALAFGMRVVAYRRSASPSPIPGVEIIGSPVELAAQTDHLVIAAPATPATRHMVGTEVLAAAKPGLHLVNISRGSLLDQEALRAALDASRVAAASLDVCEPEPLPAGHWLYADPRVRLSPHLSWSMPDAVPQLFDSFRTNLQRYLANEPLEGRVDLENGY